MNLNREVDKFIRELECKNYSSLTIISYKITLREFLSYVQYNVSKNTIVLNLMPYRYFIMHQSRKTIARKLSTIRAFISCMRTNDIKVIVEDDDKMRLPQLLPKPINSLHIFKVLETLHSNHELSYSIIIVIYGLGLRVSELCALKIQDIEGKGRKIRYLPLIESIHAVITSFIIKYHSVYYIFEEKPYIPYSTAKIRYMIRKSFNNIMNLHVTPHQLRHSFATDMFAGGASIITIKQLLGHESLSTTQIYTKTCDSTKS